MELVLAIAGWTVFGLAILVGLALNLLGLFGCWVILAAVGVAWLVTGFERFSLVSVLILAGLALLGEVLEAVAAGMGAARFGGGKGAMVAAVVGCILGGVLGSPVFPVLGTVLGACVGSFVGAALYEYIQMERRAHEAAWTGFGAALGKVAGMLAKFMMGLLQLFVAALTF